jgi:tRNA G18 (ribose-2'-O)-methylase SpoU
MNTIPLVDPLDPRLDPYRDLRLEDVRRRGDRFIAEGRLVVQRLLTSGYATVSILAEPKRLPWVSHLVSPDTPILVVSSELIQEVAGFNFHRGLLACGRRIAFSDPADLFQVADPNRIAMAAITVNDLENLGSLIRTAAAFGIDDLLLNRQSVDPLCRRVLRVSMGAALKMTYVDWAEPLAWLEENRRRGTWFTIATTLAEDSIPMGEVTAHPDFQSRPKMILMGNEAEGLPHAIQQACDVRARIPMAAGIDSLNVSVAGAISIYELVRSRRG